MKSNSSTSTTANLFWKFAERISAQLVSTVVSIVLARILCPDDYGVVSIVTILITLCNAFVVGGLGNTLIQRKDADELDFSSVFYASMALSAIIYVCVYAGAVPISKIYGNRQLIWIIRVMAIRIPIAAINSIQQAYISRQMKFKKFFIATLFGTIVSAVVGIGLALKGAGPWALVGQYLTNVTIDTIVLFFVGGWTPKWMFSLSRLKSMLPFGMRMMLTTLLDSIFTEIRGFVISLKYSPTDLAVYDNGGKYPNLLVNNINTSIGSVMFPVMAKEQHDPTLIKATMKKSIRTSSFLLAPMLMGFFAVANRFISVLLTDKWLPSAPYLRITCIMCLFYPIHTINSQALNAIGESGKTLKLEVIKKILNITILLVSMNYGVMGIALGSMIVSLISTYINAVYSKQYFDYSFIEQMKDISMSIGLSVFMTVVIILLDHSLKMSGIISLAIEIALGGILYFVGAVIFRMPELKILLQYAKKIIPVKNERRFFK